MEEMNVAAIILRHFPNSACSPCSDPMISAPFSVSDGVGVSIDVAVAWAEAIRLTLNAHGLSRAARMAKSIPHPTKIAMVQSWKMIPATMMLVAVWVGAPVAAPEAA